MRMCTFSDVMSIGGHKAIFKIVYAHVHSFSPNFQRDPTIHQSQTHLKNSDTTKMKRQGQPKRDFVGVSRGWCGSWSGGVGLGWCVFGVRVGLQFYLFSHSNIAGQVYTCIYLKAHHTPAPTPAHTPTHPRQHPHLHSHIIEMPL